MELKLKYAELFPEVWKSLGEIKREGWVIRNIENPETDKEHVISCMKFMDDNRDELLEFFSDSEIDEYINELEVHEYSEWKDGDKPPVITDDPEEKKRYKALKFEREYNTMAKLRDDHGEDGQKVFDLWLRFETKVNGDYSFPKQVDWYQSIEMAWYYEIKLKISSTQAFIDHYRNDIVHPFLVNKMVKIESLVRNTRI